MKRLIKRKEENFIKKELLFVDGYNMIGAWPKLVKLKNQNEMSDARDLLLHELSNYSEYENIEIRVVFDAQLVPGIQKQYKKFNLTVIFTKENETADSFIESAVGEENMLITNVTVATSDLAEQWIVFQKGASRKSANELYKDIQRVKKNIQVDTALYQMNQHRRNSPLKKEDEEQLKHLYRKMVEDKLDNPM